MDLQDQLVLMIMQILRVLVGIFLATKLYKWVNNHRDLFGGFDTINELKQRNYAVAAVICTLLYCLFRSF